MSTKQVKRRSREGGSILVLGTMVMFSLMAFMGLAFDASYMYYQKRRMQTAADAGALGIAQVMYRGGTLTQSTAEDVARKDAGMNSFVHNTNNVDVQVNIPPSMGPRAGNSNYAEVIVTQPQPTWFMRIANWNSATIRARAVAGLTAGDACVYALNSDSTNQNNGFKANGTTNSNFGCSIYSNSNFRAVGQGCVSASMVSYTNVYDNHNTDPGCGPQSTSQGVQTVDPFISMANALHMGSLPPAYDCSIATNSGVLETSTSAFTIRNYSINGNNATVDIKAGVYCGGISATGSVSTIRFVPDSFGRNYFILVGGGLSINSGITVTGSGVTFFNTYGANPYQTYDGVRLNVATLTLTAPTSGAYTGLLFWQDPRVAWSASNGSSVTASSASTVQGIVYFPTTDLTYSGSSSTVQTGTPGNDGYTILVGYNINVNGGSRINADFSSLPGGVNPNKVATFVE